MNKQLAKKGTTLNKNITNTEKLNLADLTVTDLIVTETISLDEITAHFINTESISTPELAAECCSLTVPTQIPQGVAKIGDVYFDIDASQIPHIPILHIYDGSDWVDLHLL